MDYDEAVNLWCLIRSSALTDLRQDLIDLAVRYARARVDYHLAEPEKQRWMGHDRSTLHNALISACDVLARNMVQHGEDRSWRDRLGNDRKIIGDFACYLHVIFGIAAR